ncbi:MAG TPA: MBL fold metallo-hydrolase [Thermodesulfobacteriota bacterium]|nr:MBL fold metallo-hydrolase [Thermodesulfobacteriota bacterium]
MKRRLLFLIGLLSIGISLFPLESEAACRNPNMVKGGYSLRPAAASGGVEIKWFGHSFFQITSSQGTKIITDPFGAMGFPMPEVWPHVVTVGREHGNHNNVGLAKGAPLVLRGMKEGGQDWNEINLQFRDVLIYNVPVHQRGVPGFPEALKGSAFVFEVDGLCICHSGDVSEPFNDDQLQLIGHVDILLQTIGGVYTIGPEEAKKVVKQLKPKIVVPMHYWYHMGVLERFTDGPYPARSSNTNNFSVSKDTLPLDTEIYVLKVVREGDL